MGNSPSCCFEGICGRRPLPEELHDAAVGGFTTCYDLKPTDLGVAPGRAEVLGNHTDYNEGYILSCAIDKYVVVAGRRNPDSNCSVSWVASASFPGRTVEFSHAAPKRQEKTDASPATWANYVMGVVSELSAANITVGSFQAYVVTNVPLGAGVSSSAALGMATAKLLARLFPESVGKLSTLDLAKRVKAAENNFVGLGCGILDQFSSGMGRAGNLIYLDCRTLDYDYAPFRNAEFVIANTNAPHSLVDGAYNELRKCCFNAAEALKKLSMNTKITHLRDVDAATLEKFGGQLRTDDRRRAEHIVHENDRVQDAIRAMKAGDMATLGKLMTASHASSRDLFGNSCKELNVMTELAMGIDGYLGSRLMGGGFGGSTISLVSEGQAERFAEELAKAYEEKTRLKPSTLICRPARGAWNQAA